MTQHEPKDVSFYNARGEPFHLTIFSPAEESWEGSGSPSTSLPVLLCVHGAGMSGDCFRTLANFLEHNGQGSVTDVASSELQAPADSTSSLPPIHPPCPSSSSPLLAFGVSSIDSSEEETNMWVITWDLRCHGTSTYEGGELNLTQSVLVQDFVDVLNYTKQSLFPNSHFYILGHSLGGAIVARGLTAHKEVHKRISGIVVVEVVEGTAKTSLRHMQAFLERRPTGFGSIKDAESWFLKHGGMHSPSGAAVSVPPLLRHVVDEDQWVWRTDLQAMQAVWDGWFDGVNKDFVGLPFPKMLCLANMERLDTELTVAQMQGKFQLEVIGNECGHYVMDDATAALAYKLRRFVRRIEVLSQKLKVAGKPTDRACEVKGPLGSTTA